MVKSKQFWSKDRGIASLSVQHAFILVFIYVVTGYWYDLHVYHYEQITPLL